jgi:excisionase family DNA binding protein
MAGAGRVKAKTPPPRLTLSKDEAAHALGLSVDSLERHVLPDLRVVRRGRRVLIPARELDRWIEANAARTLET